MNDTAIPTINIASELVLQLQQLENLTLAESNPTSISPGSQAVGLNSPATPTQAGSPARPSVEAQIPPITPNHQVMCLNSISGHWTNMHGKKLMEYT